MYPGKDTHVTTESVRQYGPFVVPESVHYLLHPDLVAIQERLDEGWMLDSNDEWEFIGLSVPAPALAVPGPSFLPEQPIQLEKIKKPLMLSEARKLFTAHREAPEDTIHYRPMTESTLESDKQALNRLESWCKKDVPIESLLDRDYKPFTVFLMEAGLSKGSAKTRIRFVKRFFKVLKDELNLIDRVPHIEFPKSHGKEKIRTSNLPYSSDELNTFFGHLIANKPGKIRERQTQLELAYLILMFIFTGFRGGEQLSFTYEDIKTASNVKYFDFTKLTKGNVSSIRMVPVHSKLIDLGFLTFAQRQKGAIFPMNSSTYRTKFDRILRELKIKDAPNSKTFHSCRATFDSKLMGKIEDSTRKTLMGHTLQGMDDIYVHQLLDEMPMYQKAVEKLVYSLDFAKLKDDLLQELDYFKDRTARRGKKFNKLLENK
jgi:integrase